VELIERKFLIKLKQLKEFAELVKVECVMNRQYFSMYDIPELIVKKKYSRRDCKETILKVLNKVKTLYLEEKPDQDTVTDDDLIPLVLFDSAIRIIEHK
jgi:UDP-N-acetylglucosamine 2-epimerase